MDAALVWLMRQWLEIAGFAATCAALFYAHLAYKNSAAGLAQARKAEITSVRLQTKTALNDARQSQVSLELRCQLCRASWDSHERKQPVRIGAPGSLGLFERSPIDALKHEGWALLQQLDDASVNVDTMDLHALEALQQRAKATSLEIQALAGKLEGPP